MLLGPGREKQRCPEGPFGSPKGSFGSPKGSFGPPELAMPSKALGCGEGAVGASGARCLTCPCPLAVTQSPPKGVTIPYRPKPSSSPVIFAGGQVRPLLCSWGAGRVWGGRSELPARPACPSPALCPGRPCAGLAAGRGAELGGEGLENILELTSQKSRVPAWWRRSGLS